MSHNGSLFSGVALLLALSFVAYYALRSRLPDFARIILAAGGAAAGGIFFPALFMLLIVPFRHGWNLFGLFVWGSLIFGVVGGVGGVLAALWWSEETPARRRVLGIVLLSVLGIAPVCLLVLPIAVRSAIPQDPLDGLRARGLAIRDFAASAKSVAFQTPLADGRRGLVFVDRATRQAKLIVQADRSFHDQYLSADGERLLFVRSGRHGEDHELIVCTVANWQCRVVLQTKNDVVSPVEIEPDRIVFASSPPSAMRDRVHYAQYDFYLVTVGTVPVKLSNIGLLGLHSINVSGDTVIFDAVGSRLEEPAFLRNDNKLPHSEIFRGKYDRDLHRVSVPVPSKSLVLASGYSIDPAVSRDGAIVALRNAEYDRAGYRFDIAIVDIKDGLRRRIALEGGAFSRPVFAGDEVIFAEVFDDRYRVRVWDGRRDAVENIFEAKFSDLAQVEHAKLVIEPPG